MIDFRYDLVNDIVIATVHYTLRTREDVLAWHQEWKRGLKQFTLERKPDVVIVLDDFHVQDEALSLWGTFRADLTRNHMGINYCVGGDTAVRVTIFTSGVRFNAPTAEADTVEEAIECIRAVRRRAQLSQRGIMASLG
ncbi:hypothetical protein JY651_23925 [Pyxidicoccus parkwayensis]|jgi:hypothetical protein|uniref:Uncharacterized protein n=1 Tax=Pyxidicoccus parkwayensis TaxID=2813578 RepID=A0ABX7PBJ1_9BACT|nr:hypothetical protein [Pyxidicoccus parkwaysis]QSQ27763.1 hypothetical protein JY651_23925 [Pyxidicoccus parkwaysis]